MRASVFRPLTFLYGCIWIWLTPSVTAETKALAPPHPRPNILFILTDDQRWDTVGAFGNRVIQTPNIDCIVNRGFTFTNAFCMGSMVPAVCIPSRAMLLTGRSLFRATDSPESAKIPSKNLTAPELFRRAGYLTAGIGKWHNDRASYARSFSAGGAIFFGGMGNHGKMPLYRYDPSGGYSNGPVYQAGFSSEIFATEAVNFLKTRPTQPFFLYVAFTAPHDPRQVPKGFENKYGDVPLPGNFMPRHPFDNGEMNVRDELLLPVPRDPQKVRAELVTYYAMISHLDEQIGRILDALESTGNAKNTIIVFGSDHGLALGSHGLLGKQNLYDHSVRAPLIFSGPGVPAGRGSAALVYLYDIFPTLCELTGRKIPSKLAGKSLLPIMAGKTDSVRSEVFGAYRDLMRMIRTDRWKLISYRIPGKEQLFDIAQDPLELTDLSGQPASRKTLLALRRKMEAAQLKLGDPLNKPSPPPQRPGRSL